MSADGKKPTVQKRYYDIISYFVTQATFSFTTAPFVVLTLQGSLLVWSRVYFYVIIGIAASMAFFASPAKVWLTKTLNKRNHPVIQRTTSQETIGQPLLGLPSDPAQDIDEVMNEVREEFEARRRKGLDVKIPTGDQLKEIAENKLQMGKAS